MYKYACVNLEFQNLCECVCYLADYAALITRLLESFSFPLLTASMLSQLLHGGPCQLLSLISPIRKLPYTLQLVEVMWTT